MRPRMRAMSYQAEEGREEEQLDQDEDEQEQRVDDEHFKKAQTSTQEVRPEVERKETSGRERDSAAAAEEEDEEEGQLERHGGNETWTEEELGNATGTNSSTTNSSFIDHDQTRGLGSSGNTSTAVASVSHICPDGSDELSCRDAGSSSAGPDGSDVKTSSSGGSGQDSGVHQVLEKETLAGTHPSATESEFDPPGSLDVRTSGQSRSESEEELDLLLRSEPFKMFSGL